MKVLLLTYLPICLLAGNMPGATISGGGAVVNTSATPVPEVRVQPIKVDPNEAKFRELLKEAGELLDAHKFTEAAALVGEAESLRPDDPDALSLLAAIKVESNQLPEAREIYVKLQKLQPTKLAPQFNLGELEMMQEHYGEARKVFEAARATFPDNELLRFKIILTYLKEKQPEEARREIERFKFQSDTAAYYYANAALDLFNNNTNSAREWSATAERIFGMRKANLFAQALARVNMILVAPTASN